MRHLVVRLIHYLVCIGLIVGSVPPAAWASAPTSTGQPTAAAMPAIRPPAVVTHQVPPYVAATLPSLHLDLMVTPDPLTIGQTATVSLTVTNNANHPADDLRIFMPVPAGVTPLSVAPDGAWQWTQAQLAGHQQQVFTATLQLDRMPQGQALLLKPQATARG